MSNFFFAYLECLITGSLQVKQGHLVLAVELPVPANTLKQISGPIQLLLTLVQVALTPQGQAQTVTDLGLILSSTQLFCDCESLTQVLHSLGVVIECVMHTT